MLFMTIINILTGLSISEQTINGSFYMPMNS